MTEVTMKADDAPAGSLPSEHLCYSCRHKERTGYCEHPTRPRHFLADEIVIDCDDHDEAPDDDRQVVGHKTFSDGQGGLYHEPLTKREADAILAECDRLKAKREADMPTEQDAINALQQAYLRLKELGWRNAIYCPKDGSAFNVIEAGSTGIHDCAYWGDWPSGSWNVFDEGDVYPSRPILFRLKEPPHKETGDT